MADRPREDFERTLTMSDRFMLGIPAPRVWGRAMGLLAIGGDIEAIIQFGRNLPNVRIAGGAERW